MPQRKIPFDKIKKMVVLHAEGRTNQEIADELGVHYQTVFNNLKRYKSMLDRHEKKKDEEVADLLDQLLGDTPKEIIDKILNIINNQENLHMEFLDKGLDPLNRVLGTISDKILKIHEIEQKRQMQEDQKVANDNFFNAMEKALNRLDNVDTMIDDASMKDEDDE